MCKVARLANGAYEWFSATLRSKIINSEAAHWSEAKPNGADFALRSKTVNTARPH
ncbi:MAG: hypothetical protein K2J80_03905 [Oscillospiraceae bacterium]|nr:hypothetical protein [Oscillospiraceae bacterium]